MTQFDLIYLESEKKTLWAYGKEIAKFSSVMWKKETSSISGHKFSHSRLLIRISEH